jgi:hypothetical protein
MKIFGEKKIGTQTCRSSDCQPCRDQPVNLVCRLADVFPSKIKTGGMKCHKN